MTPYELKLAQKGYFKKKEREAEEYVAKIKQLQDLLTIQAYQISRWVWQKKLDIKKLLHSKSKKKTMTDEQMLEQVKMLNAMFGGEVVTGGKE